VFHAWEALTGKPPSNKALGRMTMVGLGLILALMVYALRNDLVCV
jgi:regulator of sigma E protease